MLKTILSENVANVNISKINGRTIVINTTATTYMLLRNKVASTVSIVEGFNMLSLSSDMSSPTNELTIAANTNVEFYLGAGNYTLQVNDVCSLERFHFMYLGSENIIQNTNLDISDFDYFNNVTDINIVKINVSGNIDELKYGEIFKKISSLKFSYPFAGNLYGDIADFAKKVYLKGEKRTGSVTVRGCYGLVFNTIAYDFARDTTITFSNNGFTAVQSNVGINLTYTYDSSNGNWSITDNS